MQLTSLAFPPGAAIPRPYTHGANISPPLEIHGVPEAAHSLAIVLESADAGEPVTYWLAFNFEPTISGIRQGAQLVDVRNGANHWGELDYRGPDLADTARRCRFRLLACDRMLELPNGADRRAFDRAIEGHVIEEAELAILVPGRAEATAPTDGAVAPQYSESAR